jgi:predicted amino acid racemase
MAGNATVHVDLAKIEENCAAITSRLPGIDVIAVTKVTGGNPAVARALLAGGAAGLADSRLVNIARMRAHGVQARYWLLRAPAPAQAEEVVKLADVSLESEIVTVRALGEAAARAGVDHGVVCMVDVGDLREGVLPSDLVTFVEQCDTLPGIHVEGVGVNLTCYGAIMPTRENLGQVADLAAQAEAALGRQLVVSGGNSGSLPLALRGELPPGITSLRVGESILLGVNTLTREPLLPELHLDAFMFTAPVIECLVKPSKPIGVCAQDMMGNVPQFEDRGWRRRAILAVGRQDVVPELIRPLDPRVEVLGASSDHLIVDVEDRETAPRPGDELAFLPGYGALLQLFTSPYVEKTFSQTAATAVPSPTDFMPPA